MSSSTATKWHDCMLAEWNGGAPPQTVSAAAESTALAVPVVCGAARLPSRTTQNPFTALTEDAADLPLPEDMPAAVSLIGGVGSPEFNGVYAWRGSMQGGRPLYEQRTSAASDADGLLYFDEVSNTWFIASSPAMMHGRRGMLMRTDSRFPADGPPLPLISDGHDWQSWNNRWLIESDLFCMPLGAEEARAAEEAASAARRVTEAAEEAAMEELVERLRRQAERNGKAWGFLTPKARRRLYREDRERREQEREQERRREQARRRAELRRKEKEKEEEQLRQMRRQQAAAAAPTSLGEEKRACLPAAKGTAATTQVLRVLMERPANVDEATWLRMSPDIRKMVCTALKAGYVVRGSTLGKRRAVSSSVHRPQIRVVTHNTDTSRVCTTSQAWRQPAACIESKCG